MGGTTFTAFHQYEPVEAPCIIFIIVFMLLLAAHLWQAARAKVWWMWPLIVATALEAIGYLTREYCIKNRHSKGPYLVSQVLVIASPALLAASLYMMVGKALVYGGRRFALISPNWITGIFVTMDCISIIAQSIGAAMLFNDSLSLDELKTARLILEAGLFVQVIGFSIFLFVAVWFDVKTTRRLGKQIAHLRWFMNAFYISGGLIMIRSIYRLTEFITIDFDTRPPSGYLYSHEWPYYILDAVPIAFSIGIFNVIYPPEYLPKNSKETLDHPHEPIVRPADELPEYEQFKLVTQGLAEERVSHAA